MAIDPPRPDDPEAWHRAGDRFVTDVLDRAVENIASYLLALGYGLSGDALEIHVDRMYDDLRDGLTKQDLTRALLDALTDRGEERARQLTNQFRTLPEPKPRRRTAR